MRVWRKIAAGLGGLPPSSSTMFTASAWWETAYFQPCTVARQKSHQRVGARRIGQTRFGGVQAILQCGDAGIAVVKRLEIPGGEAGIDQRPVLIVGQRGHASGVAIQKRAIAASSGIRGVGSMVTSPGTTVSPELVHPGKERDLRAILPHSDGVPVQIGGRVNIARLAADQLQARMRKNLGEIDELQPPRTSGQRLRQPGRPNIGTAARHPIVCSRAPDGSSHPSPPGGNSRAPVRRSSRRIAPDADRSVAT